MGISHYIEPWRKCGWVLSRLQGWRRISANYKFCCWICNDEMHYWICRVTGDKWFAFWLNLCPGDLKDGVESELAILDVPSGQVTRLCIQGISTNAYELWTMNYPEPVWSPDGRYIVITQWDDPISPKKYYVLVIDIQTGIIKKISENTAPIGLMINEP